MALHLCVWFHMLHMSRHVSSATWTSTMAYICTWPLCKLVINRNKLKLTPTTCSSYWFCFIFRPKLISTYCFTQYQFGPSSHPASFSPKWIIAPHTIWFPSVTSWHPSCVTAVWVVINTDKPRSPFLLCALRIVWARKSHVPLERLWRDEAVSSFCPFVL